MTVDSARRILTVASTMAEEGRRLIEQAIEMRAMALAELPAGTVLRHDTAPGRLAPVEFTLSTSGVWTFDGGAPASKEWIEGQWQRGNLRLPTEGG